MQANEGAFPRSTSSQCFHSLFIAETKLYQPERPTRGKRNFEGRLGIRSAIAARFMLSRKVGW